SSNAGPEPFERIEARIASLARQIEAIADDRPAGELLERLSGQIAGIAERIDAAPTVPPVDAMASDIQQRFDVLAGLIERRQDDAFEQGGLLLREMERRLDEVSGKLAG